MKFVSYARNAEDVLLWRAFQNSGAGFFIDVGAEAPLEGSVTQAFYERGWRGVNLIPDVQWFERYNECRSVDINVNANVADSRGIVGSMPDVEAAVPSVTLNAVCAKHAPAVIHFLRIAVTGIPAVMRGLDLNRYRPQIILVAQQPDEWMSLMLNHGYERVYADGLNSFYLAQECGELRAVFLTPPNSLDDFVSDREMRLQQQITQLQERLDASLPLSAAPDFKPVDMAVLEQAVWAADHTDSDTSINVPRIDAGLRLLFQRQGLIEELIWRLAKAQEQQTNVDAERLRYQALMDQQHAQELVHQKHVFELDQRLRELDSQIQQGQQREQRLHQEKAVVLKELHGVYEGTIWRITTPVRMLGDYGKPLARKLKDGFKPVFGKVLRKGKALLMRNQRIAGYISAGLEQHPGIRRRLRRLAGLDAVNSRWNQASPDTLSHKAADIYQKLQNHYKGS